MVATTRHRTPTVAARPRPAAVAAIKTIHTLAWLSIESCVLCLLYAGFAGHIGKRAGIAGAIVAGETLVFAGNGFRCPLTKLAERYGAESGSLTDIYLPKWFAHNMFGRAVSQEVCWLLCDVNIFEKI